MNHLLYIVFFITSCSAYTGASRVGLSQRCRLPMKTGPCRGLYRRWYFSTKTKQCEMFFYGGCHANLNNFKTKRECKDSCQSRGRHTRSICNLPKERGRCHLHYLKYFRNPISGQCEKFMYSGCGGNDNNFKTRELCEERCSHPCSLPKKRGPCSFHVKRYHYNIHSESCEQFQWGGCSPNNNNFETIEECQNECANVHRKRSYGIPINRHL